ncbi:MAG TPA: DUF3828 domain-containing protein [Bradyrhizobium sp.]|nr:DUF3828 domain-containing protein [Bradyrhizobium sp.]
MTFLGPITRRTAAILLTGWLLDEAVTAREISAATPTDILSRIYREALNGATSDWLAPARRSQFLSRSLLALWAKCDAKKPPDGDVGPIDFDLTTDTNALEVTSFRIKSEKETATAATLSVSLAYRKPYVRPDPAIVIYDFVREDGRWRIDEIRTRRWSVRDLLRHWLDDS